MGDLTIPRVYLGSFTFTGVSFWLVALVLMAQALDFLMSFEMGNMSTFDWAVVFCFLAGVILVCLLVIKFNFNA